MSDPFRADREPRPIELLRPVYLDRLRVALNPLGSRATIYLADRAFHLAPEHPQAAQARLVIAATGQDRRAAHKVLIGQLVSWFESEMSWRQTPADPPEDAVGPLSATSLVMEVAVHGRSTEVLLGDLGGERSRLGAQVRAEELAAMPELDPVAAFLISRLDKPEKVSEVIHQAPGDRARTIELLARLLSVGLVRPVTSTRATSEAVEVPIDTVVEQISERIAADLEAHPVELELEEHRALAAELVANAGSLDHYDLFEVEPTATLEEVNSSYQRLARLIHAGNAGRLEIPIGVLRAIFRTLTEAYLTLADPAKRGDYNVRLGIDTTSRKNADERRDETVRLARICHDRGVRAIEAEQYHYAIETLRESVRLHTNPDSLMLLAMCLARNPNWRRQANDFLQQALRLAPRHAGALVAAGTLAEQLGNAEDAKRHYQLALESAPGHPEALEGLERLAPTLDSRNSKRK